jgi:hypothetical protein
MSMDIPQCVVFKALLLLFARFWAVVNCDDGAANRIRLTFSAIKKLGIS